MVPQERVVVNVVLQVRSLTADFDAMKVVLHRRSCLVATQAPVPHLQPKTAAVPARCASGEHVPSVSRRGRACRHGWASPAPRSPAQRSAGHTKAEG